MIYLGITNREAWATSSGRAFLQCIYIFLFAAMGALNLRTLFQFGRNSEHHQLLLTPTTLRYAVPMDNRLVLINPEWASQPERVGETDVRIWMNQLPPDKWLNRAVGLLFKRPPQFRMRLASGSEADWVQETLTRWQARTLFAAP